jgi:hypothetical protein
MTERKCGVDEEVEVGGRTGGGQNQPAPLWELAANSRIPAATALLVSLSILVPSPISLADYSIIAYCLLKSIEHRR